MKRATLLLLTLVVLAFFAAPPASAQLVVWWNKSFIPQQDEAFKEIAQKWEKKTGKTVDLSFFALPDHPAKMLAAFDSPGPFTMQPMMAIFTPLRCSVRDLMRAVTVWRLNSVRPQLGHAT